MVSGGAEARNNGGIRLRSALLALLLSLLSGGCAMIGPDFQRPQAPVAEHWATSLDKADGGSVATPIRADEEQVSQWWKAFNDPLLDSLIEEAYRQNLDLQMAGLRILEARARLGIATGNLYPQQQSLNAGFGAVGISENAANSAAADLNYTDGSVGFDAAWELDFWGKFRRGVQAADANMNAAVAAYDSYLVTLTAEVARTYILVRTLEERISVAQANVAIQRRSLRISEARFKGGLVTELDVQQARNLLANTQAVIPAFKASLRQAKNSLAVLLGKPPQQIDRILGSGGDIPVPPVEVAVGMPAELLRRRPDVRQAELQAKAQSALVGVAKADLYPHFTLLGSVGLRASDSALSATGGSKVNDVFEGNSLEYFAGPAVSWDIFNYGRIKNQVRMQDARLQQLLINYQNTVLRAAQDVEDALAGLVNDRQRLVYLRQAEKAAQRSVDLALLQYREGLVDFQRVLDALRYLSSAQDKLSAIRGDESISMVRVYKALGGGWQLRRGQPFVASETAAAMEERTDWGDLLKQQNRIEPSVETARQ